MRAEIKKLMGLPWKRDWGVNDPQSASATRPFASSFALRAAAVYGSSYYSHPSVHLPTPQNGLLLFLFSFQISATS